MAIIFNRIESFNSSAGDYTIQQTVVETGKLSINVDCLEIKIKH